MISHVPSGIGGEDVMNFFWPGDMKNFRIKMVLMPVRDKDKKRLVFICCRNFSLVIIKETAAMGKLCQKTAVTNISYSHLSNLLGV